MYWSTSPMTGAVSHAITIILQFWVPFQSSWQLKSISVRRKCSFTWKARVFFTYKDKSICGEKSHGKNVNKGRGLALCCDRVWWWKCWITRLIGKAMWVSGPDYVSDIVTVVAYNWPYCLWPCKLVMKITFSCLCCEDWLSLKLLVMMIMIWWTNMWRFSFHSIFTQTATLILVI